MGWRVSRGASRGSKWLSACEVRTPLPISCCHKILLSQDGVRYQVRGDKRTRTLDSLLATDLRPSCGQDVVSRER